MGSLTLPATGTIYLDSSAVIYAVERIEPYSTLLQPLWGAVQAGGLGLVTSELTWLETLAKPLRDGNIALEQLFRAFLSARGMSLFPATLPIWEQAARMRGLGLKTPDALHAATAIASGCSMFVTNDQGFRRVAGLPLCVLDSLLGP